MISSEIWWGIIESYGKTIFPAQIIINVILLILVILWLVKPNQQRSTLLKIFLSCCFTWIAIGFFGILGDGLSARPMSIIIFVSGAILFMILTFQKDTQFKIPEKSWQKSVFFGLLALIFLYPFIGMAFGHFYPKLIIAGTYPCPTTALALLLLSTVMDQVKKRIYLALLLIPLLIWAVPFPIFIQLQQFGVYEDVIMLLAGLYTILMFFITNKEE